MDDATKETLLEISRLLWSIGDAFDEMDYTGRDMWTDIGATEDRIRTIALTLPDSGEIASVKQDILNRGSLHLWWSNIVDTVSLLIQKPIQEPEEKI